MTNNESKYITSKLAVPSDFEKVFSHFYFAENKSTESVTKTLLPSFQTILIFNFGSKALLYSKNNIEIEVDKCLVIGPIKQTIVYSLPPYSKFWLLILRTMLFTVSLAML
ncbi:hypothetical protein [Cloacibacterium sp.]|uniref:hypothetical protein n=1 Tax=Cloacibacterium sp. TaxID=1913682 RepID=UPI0039E563FC